MKDIIPPYKVKHKSPAQWIKDVDPTEYRSSKQVQCPWEELINRLAALCRRYELKNPTVYSNYDHEKGSFGDDTTIAVSVEMWTHQHWYCCDRYFSARSNLNEIINRISVDGACRRNATHVKILPSVALLLENRGE